MQRVNHLGIYRDLIRSGLVILFPIVFLVGRFVSEKSLNEPVAENNETQKIIFTFDDVDSLVPQNTKTDYWVDRAKIIENELSLAKDNSDLFNKIDKVKKCSLYTGWNETISAYFSKCVKSTTGSLSDWGLEEKDISSLQKLLIDSHPTSFYFYNDSKDLNIAINNAQNLCGNVYPRQLLQILLEDITAPRYKPLKCQPSNPPS